MGALVTASTWAGAGILLTIIGIVVRLWLTSEKRHAAELTRVDALHAAELARIDAAHAAELERLNRDHTAELTELRSDVAELRGRVDELHTQLDEERRRRWHAEDAAAAARREGGRPEAS